LKRKRKRNEKRKKLPIARGRLVYPLILSINDGREVEID